MISKEIILIYLNHQKYFIFKWNYLPQAHSVITDLSVQLASMLLLELVQALLLAQHFFFLLSGRDTSFPKYNHRKIRSLDSL